MSNHDLQITSPEFQGNPTKFTQAMVFIDDDTWVWELTENALRGACDQFIKVASDMTVRASWDRFRHAPFIILHWENKHRTGGAIVEEILDVAPQFDIANKLIVITTNPVHEDVVFFAELNIRKVIRPRQRDTDMTQATHELREIIRNLSVQKSKQSLDDLWQTIFTAIQKIPEHPPELLVAQIQDRIIKLRDANSPVTVRELEALACINIKCQQFSTAEQLLNEAIETNPNYFRAWNKLIEIKRRTGAHEEALALMQKMQLHNRSSIRRLVAMGEEFLALRDHQKAEFFFQSALDKDERCANALNGLAEVKFEFNELDEARRLLAKSNLAYKFAAKLNLDGIELVKKGNFGKALEHYSKAQYVLPLQEKGPQLLYNIALCYIKWGRTAMAEEFLKLALIKDPAYQKAFRTLENIRSKPENAASEDMDAA